ncbi:hypothetical protein SRAA_1191 [Serpentinimonas raichei]|uniref:Uncharacterized protein n=1 Tax=Serpentinimonas raichei TaxID=1458425 RepID=A0A060NJ22_9BURK|nr:hypothetical protein SRAA_1191 [Serpentinimonas raichei]
MRIFAYVFPARAGMNRAPLSSWDRTPRVPRSRGDEPAEEQELALLALCSPLARG